MTASNLLYVPTFPIPDFSARLQYIHSFISYLFYVNLFLTITLNTPLRIFITPHSSLTDITVSGLLPHPRTAAPYQTSFTHFNSASLLISITLIQVLLLIHCYLLIRQTLRTTCYSNTKTSYLCVCSSVSFKTFINSWRALRKFQLLVLAHASSERQ